MSCDTGGNKKIGEDWNFFLKLRIDGEIMDLNGHTYNYIIVNSVGETIKTDGGPITATGEEFTVVIPGADTASYIVGEYRFEVKFVNASGSIYLSDQAQFHCIETLHSNI